MRWAAPWVVAIVTVVWAGQAHAQPRWERPSAPTEAELAEARDLYEQGSRAVDAYRFADGLQLFERSYALSGLGAALFGLGFALQGVGRFRDARDAFEQLLAEHADLPDEFRGRAQQFLADNRARVAVLLLLGLPGPGVARVELDGAQVRDDGSRPLSIETDPGLRRLEVEAPGRVSFDWEGRAASGSRLRIDVVLEPDTRPIWESHWFWVTVGAVVVTGVVVTAVLLDGAAQLDPTTDNHIVLCEDC